MSDVLTVLRGNLYDPGSMYDYWNLVISSNSHNKDNNIIICCLVKLLEKDREIEESDVIFDYRGSDYKILTTCIMNYSVKKITNFSYKGSLSEEIMSKVMQKINNIFYSEKMFTLNEARAELSRRETILKARYADHLDVLSSEPKVENNIIPIQKVATNINLTLEDEERIFAKSMDNFDYLDLKEEPREIIEHKVDKVKDVKEIKKKKIETPKPSSKLKKKKSCKRKKTFSNPTSQTKKNVLKICEDFLLDYYSLSNNELNDKYHFSSKQAMYDKAHDSKIKYLENGGDAETLNSIINSSTRKGGRRKKEVAKI